MAGPRLEPELARQLFFEGAAVVVLGVPEGSEFGIDYSSWAVGPRFRGVKMIPPGVHFVHCSAGRAGGGRRETGPRTGLFLILRRRELRLLRWDAASEAVALAPAAPGEAEAFRENLQEMDRFLGPYPYDTLKKWVSLTSFISEAVVEQLQPESRQICAFAEVLPVVAGRHRSERAEQRGPGLGAQCRSYAEGLARLPRMEPRAGTQLRFTELPTQMYPDGATPEEITRHSMDLSYALEKVIEQRYASQPLDLLAELQFAFICFLIGNVYDAFEHWKRLLNILCRSEDAIGKYQDLYINLISVLYHQLSEIPADFFVDIISQDNFLTSTLQVFFSCTCSAAVDGTLRKKAEKFKAHLTKKFKWDFEAEPDDCAPVVVELPEGVQVGCKKTCDAHSELHRDLIRPLTAVRLLQEFVCMPVQQVNAVC